MWPSGALKNIIKAVLMFELQQKFRLKLHYSFTFDLEYNSKMRFL